MRSILIGRQWTRFADYVTTIEHGTLVYFGYLTREAKHVLGHDGDFFQGSLRARTSAQTILLMAFPLLRTRIQVSEQNYVVGGLPGG
jgi:hypothetical protein